MGNAESDIEKYEFTEDVVNLILNDMVFENILQKKDKGYIPTDEFKDNYKKYFLENFEENKKILDIEEICDITLISSIIKTVKRPINQEQINRYMNVITIFPVFQKIKEEFIVRYG